MEQKKQETEQRLRIEVDIYNQLVQQLESTQQQINQKRILIERLQERYQVYVELCSEMNETDAVIAQ
jgi:hypothetical protein